MTQGLEESRIDCPWCWESIDLLVDGSAGNQRYTEDCSVCCRPIAIHVEVDARGETQVTADRE